MSKLAPLPASLSIALLLLAAGCKPAAQPPGPPPPAVTVITAEPRQVAITYEYVGQTAGYREVEVRSRVNGIVQRRNFKEGNPVKRGESLFTIDPVPFQVAISRAEADLGVVQARLEQARRDVARLKPVLEAKAVSQKELDDAMSAVRINEAEAKSAQARLNEAKLNLSYTRVESPIGGVSSRATVSEGTLVSGPNVLLATVTQTDPMYVIFGIPDREYLAIRRDVEAGRLKLPQGNHFKTTVKLSDGTSYTRSGDLNFTDVRINTQTGTSEARAEFPNAQQQLRAGEFVRIVLEGAVRPAAIVVPQRAVLEGPKEKFVYVVNAESKVEPRPVQVGEWAGDGWIIESGIKAGERVIVDGVMKIGPGAPVQVVAAQPDAAKAGAAPVPDKSAKTPPAKSATPPAAAK
ncbi:MAG: hemolysin [Betaproteobacteria bacterium]|nr:hemolysin [Betaproteobacteria bacterium]